MARVKDEASAALIGDVVGSRAVTDRAALHDRLEAILADINAVTPPLAPLRITIGDEYQGVFATVGEAVVASFAVRLALLPEVDVRHGIGWGPVKVLAESPRIEDGPAWWAAREAIEAVKEEATGAALRLVRTSYRLGAGADGPHPGGINAALLCRDQMVGSLSERSLRLLRGLLAGRTQRELAGDEGISASAVSQRVRADGLAVIVAAQEMLREVS